MRMLITLLAFLAIPAAAGAVVIETASGERIAGYLVRQDDKEVVILRRLPDGTEKEVRFERAKLKIVYQSVVASRLEALRKEDANAYRDYAEELAEKRDDPEARETAVRLFTIAAHLDSENHGRGAMLALSRLATSAAEERRYRALAYLLDPHHDAKVLQQPRASVDRSDPARQAFLRSLQLYRQGRTNEALRSASTTGVQQCFEAAPGLMSYKDFLNNCKNSPECSKCSKGAKVQCPKCKGKGTVMGLVCQDCLGKTLVSCPTCAGTKRTLKLADDELRTILQVELWHVGDAISSAGGVKPGTQETWGSLLRAQSPKPVPDLTIAGITGIDPRLCLYRNGKWVND